MNDLNRQLGFRIKDIREDLDMTQEDLADVSGLNRSYIGDVELGKRNISLKNICKLAEGLHVKLEILFKGM